MLKLASIAILACICASSPADRVPDNTAALVTSEATPAAAADLTLVELTEVKPVGQSQPKGNLEQTTLIPEKMTTVNAIVDFEKNPTVGLEESPATSGAEEEEMDLNTDATFWFRRSYYPWYRSARPRYFRRRFFSHAAPLLPYAYSYW